MLELIDIQPILNLSAALFFGAVIGMERQWRQRLAGLSTNTPVSLGAASFVLFAAVFPEEISPTRVAAQIVSGIGFLGAGIIFREGFNVRGLHLTGLESEKIEDTDRVEVTAEVNAESTSDTALEQIVGRLSLEPAVTAARWSIRETEYT
ncbi:MAG: hypothetical protein EA407_04845 [Rhodobacteraceae bacterium]|nr:MAG: hypothetical protein EA407_04845 [Paracoccaceae bacterium]